jgi:hypothetical protein
MAATFAICCSLSWSPNAGIPPPPFVTFVIAACRSVTFERSGAPLPPVPSAPWQAAQLAAKMSSPAAASPSDSSPRWPPCSVPAPAPGAGAGPIVPSSPKSQSSSPWRRGLKAVALREEGDVLIAVVLEERCGRAR